MYHHPITLPLTQQSRFHCHQEHPRSFARNRAMDPFAHFGILVPTMPPDSPAPPPSPRDRREFYRITVSIPICLQQETDTTEPTLVERSVNLSGGGIGVTLNQPFQENAVLTCTLLLPGQVVFKSALEVLRIDTIPYPRDTYRLHARFIHMTTDNREQLIRSILQFQREHLSKHYSA
uniref:PilZ domain-containing protein n=1 Tax=Nitrospira cf. moscoviensis SBR1015 TaxID=96242 RepID=UPI000A3D1785|nr:PilZ domain-containing protein [Nitrospira cf. moscoviensis SBR1015]